MTVARKKIIIEIHSEPDGTHGHIFRYDGDIYDYEGIAALELCKYDLLVKSGQTFKVSDNKEAKK